MALTNQSGAKKYFISEIETPNANITKLVWAADPSREINAKDILQYVLSEDKQTQE